MQFYRLSVYRRFKRTYWTGVLDRVSGSRIKLQIKYTKCGMRGWSESVRIRRFPRGIGQGLGKDSTGDSAGELELSAGPGTKDSNRPSCQEEVSPVSSPTGTEKVHKIILSDWNKAYAIPES